MRRHTTCETLANCYSLTLWALEHFLVDKTYYGFTDLVHVFVRAKEQLIIILKYKSFQYKMLPRMNSPFTLEESRSYLFAIFIRGS